ncbi:MAG: hypothetical protein F6K40_38950 [Okeania sp. SIO3I5]|uniref:DUF6816 family protein n=1 Tax=Okeania sp. SIO3I5 TaxID=2607805 RepID=UPI0013BA7A43|nr:hypothetical protein [Okeania sp. SIO3I5]NEQ41842.1 hypothetical protein [Okeania sp. SIO3I5]
MKSYQNFWQVILNLSLITIVLLWSNDAIAETLADRIANFPNWENKPSISAAKADLIYPDWMAGNWNLKSTLVDMVAPLAPEIVTPGFENNRQYLDQPVNFQVRFKLNKSNLNTKEISEQKLINFPTSWSSLINNSKIEKLDLPPEAVIADREFNGLNIGKALLGDDAILSVKIDEDNPNRQTTILADNLELVSVITSRGSEQLNPDNFISCEITQQLFQGETMIYLNEVETTTNYYHIFDQERGEIIEANQITAIYLSPQDPDYFLAVNRPVALYRYQLELSLKSRE